MSRPRNADRVSLAVLSVVLALVVGLSDSRAQPANEEAFSFEGRFSPSEPQPATFTRPEVAELFWTLQPALPDGDTMSADISAEASPALGAIVFGEPKGPARILKELLNTPVNELLVSRAEAGADVPPPRSEAQQAVAAAAGTTNSDDGTIAPRSADPVSERPAPSLLAAATSAGDPAGVPTTEALPENDQAQQIPPADRATGAHAAAQQPPSTTTRAAPSPRKAASMRRIADGRAAWYQHPGRTASGETFNPDALTAAHHTLPFGTRVRVVNKETGRSVVVRINDRVPVRTKVVIDLSRASAKAIGLAGTGPVSLYRLAQQ